MKVLQLTASLGLGGLGLYLLLRQRKASPFKPTRVALVGDSHSQALFPRIRSVFETAGISVVLEESRPGWSLKKYLVDGLVGRLRAARPDFVVLSLGGNDRPQSLASYRAQVEGFLFDLGGMGVKRVLWNGPADTSAAAAKAVRDAHDTVRSNLQLILAEAHPEVTFFDAFPVTDYGHRDDGVHFTFESGGGYDRWATALRGELAPLVGAQEDVQLLV